ncbi:MAG: DUF721 domain-containing protein [Bacteroidaceae bacterium]|nr:DUF721 domain-containing protein [Bacteroidaceae bacterium]
MKRTNTENIGNVLLEYLRAMGLETPLNEYRVINAWPETVGERMAGYTKDLKIFNQTLFVSISSSAARNELMMRRTELVMRLNEKAGAQVITGIVLR